MIIYQVMVLAKVKGAREKADSSFLCFMRKKFVKANVDFHNRMKYSFVSKMINLSNLDAVEKIQRNI